MTTEILFIIVLAFSFAVTIVSINMLRIERLVEIRNNIEKLTDDVRFGTDPRAKARFKRAVRGLVKRNYAGKKPASKLKRSALAFMRIAKKTADPLDKAYALGWAGRCYEDFGDYAIAAICYTAAVELAPSDVFALERLGDFYYDLSEVSDSPKPNDESDESAGWFKRALEYDPTSARTYHKLGKLHSKCGEHEKAIKQHESAIKVNNGYVASMAEAAIESAKIGDRKNVMKFFKLAMANDIYEFEKLEVSIEKCLAQQT